MDRTNNKITIELTESELLEIISLLESGLSMWTRNDWSGYTYFQGKIELLKEKVSNIDKKREMINELTIKKICPSRIGLPDIYTFECEHDDGLPNCDLCREESVKQFFADKEDGGDNNDCLQ